MNADHLLQFVQQGFLVTLGATSSLVEVLQDPEKRDENLDRLKTQLGELAQEWAQKGSITEQEARNFVDSLIAQQAAQRQAQTETPVSPPETPTPTTDVDPQLELQQLTAQIAALRAELERMREQG